MFLPAFVAYLYLQAVVDTNRVSVIESAFAAAFNAWLPDGQSGGIGAFIKPPEPLYWSFSGVSDSRYKAKNTWIDDFTTLVILAIVIFGGLVFEIQAYYLLYRQTSAHSVLFLISATIASICVVTAWANMAING